MRAFFHPEADKEMLKSAHYYENQSRDLGVAFLEEIEAGIDNIEQFPTRWPVLRLDVRRYIIRRFPFALLYRIFPTEIEILSVAHLRRKPEFWLKRI